MKIGFYGESRADQAAMAVFVEGILGEPPEPIGMDLEGHGVTNVLNALDGVIRGVHWHSDAEALVVVIDCDDSELHDGTHNPGASANRCRLCRAKRIVDRALSQVKPRKDKPALKVAIGLAVPAIEAWYLVGKYHQVGEAAWRVGLNSGNLPFTRAQLKKLVYRTDRPSLELETECAVREARRLISSIERIETEFPDGFGLMAKEIRSWKS
jgi:hypothetical protein